MRVRQAFSFFGGKSQNPLRRLTKRQIARRRCRRATRKATTRFDPLASRFRRSFRTQETLGNSHIRAQKAQEKVFGLDGSAACLPGLLGGKEYRGAKRLGKPLEHRAFRSPQPSSAIVTPKTAVH